VPGLNRNLRGVVPTAEPLAACGIVNPTSNEPNNEPDAVPAEKSLYGSMFSESSTMEQPPTDTKVLFLAPSHSELGTVFETLLSNNLRPIHVERLTDAVLPTNEFIHIFVDVSLPGALQWLGQLTTRQDEVFPVALIQRGAREGSALAAGATGTLQLPLEPADVLLCVNRNRNRIERNRHFKEIADRDRQRIATASVEGVLTTVCSELRNPLAAALANVEYLRDIGKRDVPQANADDATGVVDDTFEALQRVRGILESLTTLVKRELSELKRVVFWEAAQSVLDELGRAATPISLSGDPTVRGWADEELLRQVLSTLTRRALNAAEASGGVPVVKIRIYATETEARISVRDNGPSLPADLMKNVLESTDADLRQSSSEMLLAVTHHAVVRMGGVLDFAQRHSPGSVFRIRLRVVRANE
jgi:signal transduction histidine kinase